MALNLGINTTQLFRKVNTHVSNGQYTYGFDPSFAGRWNNSWGNIYSGSTEIIANNMEPYYIDIGIVIDEREELTLGGIAISLPGTGVDSRINWAIGGKVIRVTLTSIIPDGLYKHAGNSGASDWSVYEGKSNVSVLRYKLNKYIGYDNIFKSTFPHIFLYRRRNLYEHYDNSGDDIANWVISGYSLAYIDGTRNVKLTLTLDLANNLGLENDTTGITTRNFGELR